jgi:hypothetical protein
LYLICLLIPIVPRFVYQTVRGTLLAPSPFGAGVGTVHSRNRRVPHNMVNVRNGAASRINFFASRVS